MTDPPRLLTVTVLRICRYGSHCFHAATRQSPVMSEVGYLSRLPGNITQFGLEFSFFFLFVLFIFLETGSHKPKLAPNILCILGLQVCTTLLLYASLHSFCSQHLEWSSCLSSAHPGYPQEALGSMVILKVVVLKGCWLRVT